MAYKTNYRPRIIDSLLHQQLSAVGGVLIEGPKQCGKTTTAEEASNSQIYMSDPTNQKRNLSLAKLNPNLLLRGAPPPDWSTNGRLPPNYGIRPASKLIIEEKLDNLFSQDPPFPQIGAKFSIPAPAVLLGSRCAP